MHKQITYKKYISIMNGHNLKPSDVRAFYDENNFTESFADDDIIFVLSVSMDPSAISAVFHQEAQAGFDENNHYILPYSSFHTAEPGFEFVLFPYNGSYAKIIARTQNSVLTALSKKSENLARVIKIMKELDYCPKGVDIYV